LVDVFWGILPLWFRRLVWVLVAFVCDIVLLPLGYWLALDIAPWNIQGQNQSPSYQHAPGLARDLAAPWGKYYLWVVLPLCGLVTLFAIVYFFVAQKDPGDSSS
jgi:hypothetical protein